MKLLKGRVMTYIALALVLLTFAGMVALLVTHQNDELTYPQEQPHRVTIVGQYSLDGGEWHDTIPGVMVHSRFHKVTIKGVLSEPLYYTQQLVIFADNIWYRLDTETMSMSNDVFSERTTPGNGILQMPVSYLTDDYQPEFKAELTLEFPYTMFSNQDLSDYFEIYVTGSSGAYQLMVDNHWHGIVFSLLICFFGLLVFPIAGTLIGGVNVRYWAFSVLCFFAGVHLLAQQVGRFLPLWLDDPVLCMTVDQLSAHLFGICVLVFIKVVLTDDRHKIIGNIIQFLFAALVVVLVALHLMGKWDLYESEPCAQLVFSIFAVILSVCLIREMNSNRDALLAVLSLIPLALTLVFDTLNLYLGFTDFMVFEIGMAITLDIQIIVLLRDLRRQYKETIRYQQIQRELYESRVAIMVSQIQPHFLYNSLSSIAMMCTIDPETAQEATVTFADYLRGNMDSLKQKTPVPFSKELEHLQKYLYIEKLRFGKKLNIVYDIQTENFVLPQLSIQPLAENAVKHGISKKRGGGTLTIATRETPKSFQVIVSDDGKGFDVNEVKNDGRSHIGMDNVRRRLKEMCGGTVTIESTVGVGTVATVTLPKEGQHHENPVC